MVWGVNSTPEFIFASSEPHNDDADGCHRAFDTNKGVLAYNLDAKEAGEAMAISPDGLSNYSVLCMLILIAFCFCR
jgi:hypothetical protein